MPTFFPQNIVNVTLQGKRDSPMWLWSRRLRWSGCPGLSRWAPSNQVVAEKHCSCNWEKTDALKMGERGDK